MATNKIIFFQYFNINSQNKTIAPNLQDKYEINSNFTDNGKIIATCPYIDFFNLNRYLYCQIMIKNAPVIFEISNLNLLYFDNVDKNITFSIDLIPMYNEITNRATKFSVIGTGASETLPLKYNSAEIYPNTPKICYELPVVRQPFVLVRLSSIPDNFRPYKKNASGTYIPDSSILQELINCTTFVEQNLQYANPLYATNAGGYAFKCSIMQWGELSLLANDAIIGANIILNPKKVQTKNAFLIVQRETQAGQTTITEDIAYLELVTSVEFGYMNLNPFINNPQYKNHVLGGIDLLGNFINTSDFITYTTEDKTESIPSIQINIETVRIYKDFANNNYIDISTNLTTYLSASNNYYAFTKGNLELARQQQMQQLDLSKQQRQTNYELSTIQRWGSTALSTGLGIVGGMVGASAGGTLGGLFAASQLTSAAGTLGQAAISQVMSKAQMDAQNMYDEMSINLQAQQAQITAQRQAITGSDIKGTMIPPVIIQHTNIFAILYDISNNIEALKNQFNNNYIVNSGYTKNNLNDYYYIFIKFNGLNNGIAPVLKILTEKGKENLIKQNL